MPAVKKESYEKVNPFINLEVADEFSPEILHYCTCVIMVVV